MSRLHEAYFFETHICIMENLYACRLCYKNSLAINYQTRDPKLVPVEMDLHYCPDCRTGFVVWDLPDGRVERTDISDNYVRKIIKVEQTGRAGTCSFK